MLQRLGEWFSSWNWGDVPTWVTGLVTAGAVSLSLLQVARERTDRRAEERRREDDERRSDEEARRAHASQVGAWYAGMTGGPDGGTDLVGLSNASQLPVYEVVVTMVLVRGAGPREGTQIPGDDYSSRARIDVVPPGEWRVDLGAVGWRGMHAHPGIEIAFRDAEGRGWKRLSTGRLEPIGEAPLDHYGMEVLFPYSRLAAVR